MPSLEMACHLRKNTNVIIYKGMPEYVYSLLIVAIGLCLCSARRVDFPFHFTKIFQCTQEPFRDRLTAFSLTFFFCLLDSVILFLAPAVQARKNNSNYIT